MRPPWVACQRTSASGGIGKDFRTIGSVMHSCLCHRLASFAAKTEKAGFTRLACRSFSVFQAKIVLILAFVFSFTFFFLKVTLMFSMALFLFDYDGLLLNHSHLRGRNTGSGHAHINADIHAGKGNTCHQQQCSSTIPVFLSIVFSFTLSMPCIDRTVRSLLLRKTVYAFHHVDGILRRYRR